MRALSEKDLSLWIPRQCIAMIQIGGETGEIQGTSVTERRLVNYPNATSTKSILAFFTTCFAYFNSNSRLYLWGIIEKYLYCFCLHPKVLIRIISQKNLRWYKNQPIASLNFMRNDWKQKKKKEKKMHATKNAPTNSPKGEVLKSVLHPRGNIKKYLCRIY